MVLITILIAFVAIASGAYISGEFKASERSFPIGPADGMQWCQRECAKLAYPAAATTKDGAITQCHCSNDFPGTHSWVGFEECNADCVNGVKCTPVLDKGSASCCGNSGGTRYSVGLVGELDIPRQLLSRTLFQYQQEKDSSAILRLVNTPPMHRLVNHETRGGVSIRHQPTGRYFGTPGPANAGNLMGLKEKDQKVSFNFTAIGQTTGTKARVLLSDLSAPSARFVTSSSIPYPPECSVYRTGEFKNSKCHDPDAVPSVMCTSAKCKCEWIMDRCNGGSSSICEYEGKKCGSDFTCIVQQATFEAVKSTCYTSSRTTAWAVTVTANRALVAAFENVVYTQSGNVCYEFCGCEPGNGKCDGTWYTKESYVSPIPENADTLPISVGWKSADLNTDVVNAMFEYAWEFITDENCWSKDFNINENAESEATCAYAVVFATYYLDVCQENDFPAGLARDAYAGCSAEAPCPCLKPMDQEQRDNPGAMLPKHWLLELGDAAARDGGRALWAKRLVLGNLVSEEDPNDSNRAVYKTCAMPADDPDRFQCSAPMSQVPPGFPQDALTKMVATDFKIQDRTSPVPGQPQPLCSSSSTSCPGGGRFECMSTGVKGDEPSTCTQTFEVSYETGQSISISSGFSLEASVSATVEVSAPFVSGSVTVGLALSYSRETTNERSLSKTVSLSYEVEVNVPAGEFWFIQLQRVKKDVVQDYAATYDALGQYEVLPMSQTYLKLGAGEPGQPPNVVTSYQVAPPGGASGLWRAYSTILDSRNIAFTTMGTWTFPGQNVIFATTGPIGTRFADDEKRMVLQSDDSDLKACTANPDAKNGAELTDCVPLRLEVEGDDYVAKIPADDAPAQLIPVDCRLAVSRRYPECDSIWSSYLADNNNSNDSNDSNNDSGNNPNNLQTETPGGSASVVVGATLGVLAVVAIVVLLGLFLWKKQRAERLESDAATATALQRAATREEEGRHLSGRHSSRRHSSRRRDPHVPHQLPPPPAPLGNNVVAMGINHVPMPAPPPAVGARPPPPMRRKSSRQGGRMPVRRASSRRNVGPPAHQAIARAPLPPSIAQSMNQPGTDDSGMDTLKGVAADLDQGNYIPGPPARQAPSHPF